ncbi:MFS general substrate transporter [Aaosphaeria arxii CBS 175.79]|uniref:MFS general substrate transporter n=1 Tax=Aaosphaeria arxii CBS 175.79 TaxID=1450172 RepID=A0A6A5XX05_9PLEO|nr:MFS general substrate transporter [Aaosphaeria arxii CBS 175.79]KAF2016794.1 MFS general substrate transporter [Aaosphaeria arxii CBS 175.79]
MSTDTEKANIQVIDDKAESVGPTKPQQIIQIDNCQVLGLDPEDAEFYLNYPAEKKKKIIHKVDIRLIPVLTILYLVSHIDRANIGNAKIEGLVEDLNLTGVQWNIALSIFFVPYVLLEVPSNMILKKFDRPSVYLGTLIVLWGVVMTLTGVVKNFAGLMITRLFLGAFEAGFYPGAVYLCSCWYMPKDLATRISYFYCASALSGAFSGLLAAAIAKMDGTAGYEGWRWIFLLEGIATVVLGVLCFFFLVDSPRLSSRWLEPDEIRYLEIEKFIKDGGAYQEEAEDSGRSGQWHDLKMVMSNWRLYMQAYLLLVCSTCSYGTKFTLPTIVKSMGFSNTNAQLMTVPPYVAGALSSIFFAKLSDHYFWRLPFVAIPFTLITIGYAVIISFDGALGAHIGPSFFAIILTCMGIYPIQPAASSWAANNLAPANRRAIGVAFNICIGSMGGVVGSYMYIESEKPKYYTGFGLSLAFGATAFIMTFLIELSYKWGNKRKARLSEDEVRAKYSDAQLRDLGDKSPLFKYVL